MVADTLHYTAFRKFTSTGDVRRHFAHDPPSMGLVNRHARALARDIDIGNTIGHPFAGEPVPAGHAWPPRIHVGPMIVGESVMGNPHHPEQRLAAGLIDNALAVDMESIGVARAVHRMREAVDYNPRLLVVRGVSDMVKVAASEDEAKDQQAEADNNAQRQEWKPSPRPPPHWWPPESPSASSWIPTRALTSEASDKLRRLIN